MSKKLIWLSYDSTCDEPYVDGMNNAIGDLDLVENTWSHVAAPRQSELGARTQPGGAYDPSAGSQRVISAVGGWGDQRLCSSSDDGATWVVQDDIVDNFKFFSWHPQDALVVYVGTLSGGLRSDDGGSSWNPVVEPIRAMFPSDGDKVYAVCKVADGRSRVLRSIDRGESWEPLGEEVPCTINDVDVSSDDERRVYAACNDGVWVHDAGGWSARGEGEGLTRDFFGDLRFRAIAVDPRRALVIYVGQRNWEGVGRGVFRSEDGGATWQNVNRNLPRDLNIWSISVSPHDSTVWLGTDNGNWKFAPAVEQL